MSSRTLVTGLGVAAPNGLGLEAYWSATLGGDSGIGPVRRFDARGYHCRLAGEVPGFVPQEYLSGRLLPQTDHMTQLALAASDWALADACADVGLTFVGPSSGALRLLGDKIAARAAMAEAGVPMLPGSTTPVASVEEARRLAGKIGYPLVRSEAKSLISTTYARTRAAA